MCTSPGLNIVFKFRIVLILDWLVTVAREHSLPSYLAHSWREGDVFVAIPRVFV